MTADRRLEMLRRLSQSDPSDHLSRHSYLRSLVRSGCQRRARQILRDRTDCLKAWENLGETDSRTIRHCGTCAKTVHFGWTAKQHLENAISGYCVAGTPESISLYLDLLLEDPAAGRAHLENRLCIFQSNLPNVENQIRISHETTIFIRGDLARHYRIVPIIRKQDTLFLAVDTPLSSTRLQTLSSELPHWSLEFKIAPPEQITTALELFYPQPPRPDYTDVEIIVV